MYQKVPTSDRIAAHSFHPPNAADGSLLRHAVRIGNVGKGRVPIGAPTAWYRWVAAHSSYVARYPYTGDPAHLTFSPDQRFALWRSEGRFIVADLEQDSGPLEWQDESDEKGALIWMPDNQRWFVRRQGTGQITLTFYDRLHPKNKQVLPLPGDLYDTIDLVTAQGTALGHDYITTKGSFPNYVLAITVAAFRLFPVPRLMQRYRIDRLRGHLFRGVHLSPAGNRIAWTLAEQLDKRSGSYQRSVWISSLEGTTWRELGTLPPDADDKAPDVFVAWTPDGSHLIIQWNNALWRVPVH